MPTDRAAKSVEVAASCDRVMEILRDVGSQTEWIPEILEAEVTEEYVDDGLPATARFRASATVGTDEYTLSYEHADRELSWTMLSGRLQTGQEGHFTVTPLTDTSCQVDYELTIHHNLPLPGFVRRHVINGLVDNTLRGLQEYAVTQ